MLPYLRVRGAYLVPIEFVAALFALHEREREAAEATPKELIEEVIRLRAEVAHYRRYAGAPEE